MRTHVLFTTLSMAALTAAAAAPLSAQATFRDIRVCVLQDGALREVVAEYNTQTGDTLAGGQPFSQAYPATSPPYAAGVAIYVNNESFRHDEVPFEKYGLPRILGVNEVTRIAYLGGVPVFAEAGGSAPYEVLYLPVRPGCEFQPYQAVPPAPGVRILRGEELRFGSIPNDVISIEEIRFTSRATEVLLRFQAGAEPYAGNLHAPSDDLAMYLRDARGTEYDLTGQEGWPGSGNDGFGSATIPAGADRLVILYFEPVRDPAAVDRLDLIEGDCEEGCWHFYDIRLQDGL